MERFLKVAADYAGYIMAIVGCLTAILWKPIKNAHARRKVEKEEERKFRRDVLEKLDAITDDVADLQYERLSQAHDFYVGRGWCPTSKKQQLCNMYRSYTDKGRNHLSAHYEKEILELKDSPED
ncbi:MAG: hypothetical protein IJ466_11490 [Clostridia bacterium]|nr:hypothetical protein [Clostridia bacterium]